MLNVGWPGLLALVGVASLAAGLGWLLARQRSLATTALATQRAEAWQRARPGIYWVCDAQWRVVSWHVQAMDTVTAAVVGQDLRATLRDAPSDGDGATAHELLAAHGTVAGRAVHVLDGSEPLALYAEPLHDAAGRFAGYAGVFAERPRRDDAALVQALVNAERPPLLLLRRPAEHAAWIATAASPDGRAWLAEAAAPMLTAVGSPRPWQERLPAGVQALLAQASPVGGEADGWRLSLVPGGAPGECIALLFAPTEPTATDADDALSFSYTLSHDLRAPVRVVEGFARIVKEDYGAALDRVGNDHLDRVLGAAARMNQMIDALLAMARLSAQPLVRQPVNLSRLAQFVVDDLRRGAPDRAIQIRIDPDLAVTGDPTLLRQVLENLLGNAWKYTQRSHDPQISLGVEQVDGRRTFVVRDNGAGFDMRGVDRLFGLFQRLHSASDFPGTGVGLASVKRIVQRHGGRIWAEAEPGRGAVFYFTLRD